MAAVLVADLLEKRQGLAIAGLGVYRRAGGFERSGQIAEGLGMEPWLSGRGKHLNRPLHGLESEARLPGLKQRNAPVVGHLGRAAAFSGLEIEALGRGERLDGLFETAFPEGLLALVIQGGGLRILCHNVMSRRPSATVRSLSDDISLRCLARRR